MTGDEMCAPGKLSLRRRAAMLPAVRATFALLIALAVPACASAPRTFADSMTVPVTVVNRTHDAICFLYLSPINDDAWTDDLLGSATVADGSSRGIRVPPGNWDIRIENCQHEGGSILRGARIARGSTLVLQ